MDHAETNSHHPHGVSVIPVLSVAIVLLVILLLILVFYIAFIKWRKSQRRRLQRVNVKNKMQPLTGTVFRHTHQSVASIAELQKMAIEKVQALPANVPELEDEEFQNSPALGCEACDADLRVQRNDLKMSREQLDLITPDSCGSGRLDSELTELFKKDMMEGVTIRVDGKLLVFISREIDDMGGTLVLDKMGVSLLIPPCAIPRGQKEIIQLILDWDPSDYPPMTDSQTIVSPIVHCGPHGLKLAKPAILSFMHCADDVRDVVVLASETHLTQDKHWKPIQHRRKYGKVEYEVLENQCQVYLSHFSIYTSIAQGSLQKMTKKWIMLAAFGKKEGGQFQVFIYMLNNTPCALQFAIQQQGKYNCPMLRCPLEFLIDEEGGDLIFDLKHVSEGWNPVGRKWEDVGLFQDIWKEKCNTVSFTFKHDNPACTDLTFNICLFQKNMPDVKRHFEFAMSFPNKRLAKSTERQLSNSSTTTTTNLNLNLTQALPSIVINGLERRISSTPSETISIKSAVYGGDQPSQDTMIKDQASTENGFDNDLSHAGSATDTDDGDEKHVSSKTKGNQEANNRTVNTSSRGHESRRCSGNSQSTSTTNINIHTETIMQPPTPFDQRALLQDDPPTAVFPLRLRSKLIALLDPPCPLASTVNDWRVLAESLNLDSLVSLIRMKPSPTEELLDIAAQKGKDCSWLFGVLRDAERYDAADEVAKYLDEGGKSLRQNSVVKHVDEDDDQNYR